jgi:threonine dehydrogenase-like Zn-dependent dehydrogenase
VRGLYFDPGSTDRVAHLRRDLPVPEPSRGEARIRVRLAGICRTDIEILRGYVPFEGVLGHEFVGTVDSAPGSESLVGRRVVGEINAACGECEWCRRGPEGERHCPSRTVLGIVGRDGCLADFCVLPARSLHIVPESVTDGAAVFAEPLAAAFRIIEQVELTEDTRACVLGDGKLGLLVAMVLKGRVGELMIAGRHEEKLAVAARAGIATVRSDSLEPGRDTFDIVVDATGRPEGARQALSLVRPLGTLVMKSTVAGDTSLPLSEAVVNEVTVVGSRCGPFGPALRALADGEIDPEPLIAARYSLDEAEEALRRAAEPGALKVLVAP